MRICMLTDAWFPWWRGGQVHVWEVSKRLVENYRCRVDVVVPYLVEKKEKYPRVEKHFGGKLRVIRLGGPFVFPNLLGRLWFVLSSIFYLLSFRYDVYHSHSYSTSALVWLTKILRRGKFVFTLHGVGTNTLGGGFLNRLGISRLGETILYSFPYDLQMTAAASSIRKEQRRRFVVVGNGVDFEEFDKEPAVTNRRYFQVVCVARREDPVKGVEVLEEAIAMVRRRYPQVRLCLVSGRERTAADFKKSNLYVLPSLSEGLPIVLLEAMAARLPVVVTDVGDCREVVEKAEAGLVVPPGNSSALAAAIGKMRDNKVRRKFGRNGYSYVKKNYRWEEVTARVFQNYERIVS